MGRPIRARSFARKFSTRSACSVREAARVPDVRRITMTDLVNGNPAFGGKGLRIEKPFGLAW
jgi:hypothetical protein